MTKSGASVVEVTGAHGDLCWVGIYQVQHGGLMKPEKTGDQRNSWVMLKINLRC